MTDPTRMRNQPELTTASGATWLVVGVISAIVFAGMMLALWWQLGDVRALASAIVTGVLLLAMLVVRATVTERRARLTLLAALFGAMVLAALIVVVLVLVAVT